jgi:3-hydroxyacyl-[acyl-carrier-protein] dehydratase
MDQPHVWTAPLGAEEILAILPHRPPFLFVDRIVELEPGERAVGVKNVTLGEPFFAGHFPRRPIMPGVLILEAMAQVGGVALLSTPAANGRLALFGGVDRVRFRHPVTPGDQLRLEVEIVRRIGPVGKGRGRARVGDLLVAEGDLTFSLVE